MARVMVPRGVLYMLASAFGFSMMAVFVKLASARLPVGEVVLARVVVTLVITFAMVQRARVPPWGTNRAGLVARGLVGSLALALYYVSLERLPLAEATTIQNTVPIITAVLGWWFLREHVGPGTLLGLALGAVGVTLVARPGGVGLDLVGVWTGLAAAVCSSIAYVTIRQLTRTEHQLVIILYFPLIALPLALPWAIATWQTPTGYELALLLGVGVSTQIGQIFITKALALEPAGRATALGYVQVAFAMGWQALVFAEMPTVWTVSGALLVIASAVVVGRVAARARAGSPPPGPTSAPPPA